MKSWTPRPRPSWAFVLPKIIAIAIVLFSMALISVGAALCVQAVKGYFDFELSHYAGLVCAAVAAQHGDACRCWRYSSRCWCLTSSAAC